MIHLSAMRIAYISNVKGNNQNARSKNSEYLRNTDKKHLVLKNKYAIKLVSFFGILVVVRSYFSSGIDTKVMQIKHGICEKSI